MTKYEPSSIIFDGYNSRHFYKKKQKTMNIIEEQLGHLLTYRSKLDYKLVFIKSPSPQARTKIRLSRCYVVPWKKMVIGCSKVRETQTQIFFLKCSSY